MKKKIGRVVVNLGDFNPNKVGGYDQTNRVFMYDCEFESLVDGNMHTPVTIQNGKKVVEEHWKLVCGILNPSYDEHVITTAEIDEILSE